MEARARLILLYPTATNSSTAAGGNSSSSVSNGVTGSPNSSPPALSPVAVNAATS